MSEHAETSFYLFLSQTITITGNAKCCRTKIILCPHVLGLNASFAFISSCCESMTHQTTSTAHAKCWRRKNRFQDVCLGVLRTSSPFNLSSQNILHLTMQLML